MTTAQPLVRVDNLVKHFPVLRGIVIQHKPVEFEDYLAAVAKIVGLVASDSPRLPLAEAS